MEGGTKAFQGNQRHLLNLINKNHNPFFTWVDAKSLESWWGTITVKSSQMRVTLKILLLWIILKLYLGAANSLVFLFIIIEFCGQVNIIGFNILNIVGKFNSTLNACPERGYTSGRLIFMVWSILLFSMLTYKNFYKKTVFEQTTHW